MSHFSLKRGSQWQIENKAREMEEQRGASIEGASVVGASLSCSSKVGHSARELTDEEAEKLKKEAIVSQFKQEKLEKDARKNWDLFYKRNGTRFFKDRHWTTREFFELIEKCTTQKSEEHVIQNILEVGCGVGNTLFPLLEENPNLFIYACDFSQRAIQFVKENAFYNEDHCCAFQCDLTSDDLTNHIQANSIELVTMIFVLSAILPSKMQHVINNISKVLKPGGMILFRDYGLYDHAMLRFSRGHKLSDNLYVRQDGTRSFFFSTDSLSQLFKSCGFDILVNEYNKRITVNKKEQLEVPRIFVQGKFLKKQ